MLPYALTIFTGAFLLFQVQPLIGKYILPWFGGGPGVWTTCLLFFQVLLLGGYAYAHFSTTYLKPKRQALVHFVLLAASLALLPIAPAESWKAHVAGNPVGHILLLLAGTIGLPYFVLSSTGPLMQRWFAETHPTASPYRLYALSNLGSLLALLSYPFFFEVKFTRHDQAVFWSGGLVVFALYAGYCAWLIWKSGANATVTAKPSATNDVSAPEETATPRADRLLWLGLPAIASLLLLATTNKLCQEVAVIPFLWVLPLSLYLLSFIICFDHARWYVRGVWLVLLAVGAAFVVALLAAGNSAPLSFQIVGYNVTLFAACMVCHGELYRLKPAPRQLTAFYLFISAGGALGGFLVAVVAPAVFNDYYELQIGLWVLSYVLGVVCLRQRSRTLALGVGIGAMLATVVVPLLRSQFDDGLPAGEELLNFYRDNAVSIAIGLAVFVACTIDFRQRRALAEWRPQMAGFLMVLCFALGAAFLVEARNRKKETPLLSASRNFYGTLKVYDYSADDAVRHYHLLLHGATTHGLQFVSAEREMWHTTYYASTSGVGLAIGELPAGPRRLGLVGLGTGTLASYGRAGDTVHIYEINPAVENLSHTTFTYVRKSPAKVEIAMGDARLSMERELADGRSQQFDLLALDAFSSDAIPVHLLTKESFEIYLRQIKPDGVIAVHVSNRYLDLRPVVENLAAHFGLSVATIFDDDEDPWWVYRTTWILVTKNKALLSAEKIANVTELPEKKKRTNALWTDDFASIYEILK
ncbi:MAG TPA: fused MFS/spermidine synthase [Opitutaceae bacterium]|nr:fused MFS/spermidine synthase [Opitutaceae bacterium]